jgi:hypothetical protein
MQVHKENIDKIPNALPNRNSVDVEVYGMEGIPEDDLRDHERSKVGGGPNPLTALPVVGAPLAPGMPPKMPTGPSVGQPPPPHALMGMPGMSVPPMMMPPPMMPPGHPPPFMVPGMMSRMPFPPHMPPPPHGLHLPPGSQLTAPPHGMQNLMPPLPPNASHGHGPPQPPPPLPPGSALPSGAGATAAAGAQPQPPPLPASMLSALNNHHSNKPLFPSALSTSSVAGDQSSAPNSNDANSSESMDPSSSSRSEPNDSSQSGQRIVSAPNCQIVHPDEDISLEEHRARLAKYKNLCTRPTTEESGGGSMPASTGGSSASQPVLYTPSFLSNGNTLPPQSSQTTSGLLAPQNPFSASKSATDSTHNNDSISQPLYSTPTNGAANNKSNPYNCTYRPTY